MQKFSRASIALSWLFSVPPLTLWQAWTEPDIAVRWFGSDPKGTVVKAAFDVRIGGSFEVSFRNADGAEHTCFGIYKEVEFCRKLVFSWSWKSSPDIEERVQVLLISVPHGTQMAFEHSDIKDGTGHNYETGWRNTFEKLESVLSNG